LQLVMNFHWFDRNQIKWRAADRPVFRGNGRVLERERVAMLGYAAATISLPVMQIHAKQIL
jgi:hypothetical protein